MTGKQPPARLTVEAPSYVSLGILSDSHGNVAMTTRGVEALLLAGADALVHLGDLETREVLEALLTESALPVHLVFGNVDWPVEPLAVYARVLDFHVHHPCGELICAGRRIVFHHGHELRFRREALAEGVDYILEGHTHEATDERLGASRLINPGALQRASSHSVALLTPGTGKLELLPVSRG